jgi:hypothetical protein
MEGGLRYVTHLNFVLNKKQSENNLNEILLPYCVFPALVTGHGMDIHWYDSSEV